ncbi:Lovastatin diketide synthase [Alternaria arborescens]|uniref:Lovastatin diketide synthase n=1 Tax=Alternaria arborescens TaxID=156630 RepID=UPI001074E6AD|nr:Lovastatin diketide synthase [Alternaria arborescens]RYO32478.1 Lovastatin diketide synthase [Alternaria arborescens]
MNDFVDPEGTSMPASSPNGLVPIAIVGFGFKFPQDITNAESLWKLLMERRSTMTEIPQNRWNIDGFYKEHGHRPGTVKNRGGHFLADDPARFDAPFFSVQPAEAECMDPQQRLLLETSYHALENAGIPMKAAMGTRTSVHVGCLLQEYSQISQRDSQMPGDYRIVGSSGLAMLANRLSWFYDFSGPSMTVDTACSGGLVAFHLACQELSAGSVDMSLVCGNNLCLLPDSTALLSSLSMMSKDSVCYSFDERASGYARGEGFGVLILKRLDTAIADGDTIRGVVRSTGCGQDGNTPSITSPSQSAQERLIRETYARAGLDLGDTRYFEAHGTGTPVGDPCEAAAISNVFSCRTPEDPIFVGALKSNMGHPEGASGIAGVIKTLLVLEKGIIPPNVYPERISPAVAAAGPNLKFPLVPATWPTDGIRRASVNSFGYGGTNAHVVLDDALSFLRDHGLSGQHCTEVLDGSKGAAEPVTYDGLAINSEDGSYSTGTNAHSQSFADDTPPDIMDDYETAPKLFVLSAFDERAVQRSISTFEKWLCNHANDENDHRILNDVAYTLAEKRTSFPWKTACVASPNLLSQLSWSTPTRVKQRVNLCFVFTGQGAQWYGMGRELMGYTPFRDAMLGADRYFKSLGSKWSLIDELYLKSKDDSIIHQPELSQPICTALQVAIHDLLISWKVRASISVGHSSGEIAAAYASRAISQESAWMIAYFRGLAVAITQTINPSQGAMIAVQAPFETWKHIMNKQNAEYPTNPVVIACYNSQSSFTLSGTHSMIHQMAIALKQANVEVHTLKIDVAYHSHHMKPVADVYEKLLRTIEPGEQVEAQPSFVSTVTGKNIQQLNELHTSEYWQRNLTGSVQFSAALQDICARQDASTYFFLEIGPHSVLRSPLRDILKQSGRDVAIDYSSVLRRDHAANITALECAGKLHTIGATIDIAKVNKDSETSPKFLPSLPCYQFEDKKRYWLEGRTSIQYRQTQFVHHELLGSRTPDWNEHEARWTNRILLDQSPYLQDHQINGLCLMPAAGMLSMAIEATRQYYGHQTAAVSGYKLKDVTFTKAMTLSADARGTEIQLTLRPAVVESRDVQPGSLWNQFSLFLHEDGGWHLCCTGFVAIEYGNHHDSSGGLAECATATKEKKQAYLAASEKCRIVIDSADIYDAFSRAGLTYGPTFKGMRNVKWDQHNQATGTIGLRDWQTHAKFSYSDPHLIHPAALDAILQMTFPAYSIYAKDSSATTVPTGFSNAWFSVKLMRDPSDAQDVAVHAKVSGRGFRNKLFSVTAAFANTQEICFYGDLETSTIGRNSPSAGNKEGRRSLYRINWQPAEFHHLTTLSPRLATSKSCIHIIYDELEPLQLDLMHTLRRTMSAQGDVGVALVTWSSIDQHELDKASCIFLPGLDGNLLQRMQKDELAKIKSLLSKASTLLWVTFQHQAIDQSPTEGLVSGLVRTLATESEDYRLSSISLDPETGLDTVAANIVKVATTLLEPQTDPEDEYCEIDGRLCTPRVVDDAELTVQALPTEDTVVYVTKPWSELDSPKLTIGAAGVLNTLHYEQTSIGINELASDDVVVQVKAVGLNMRDILVALGQVHDETFGSEVAGVVVSTGSSHDAGFQIGDRVFGVTRDGVAQLARCKVSQLQKVPNKMSFCEAAAYPVAFCTAYYSLKQCYSMKSGDSILVHDAASVLGQAIIKIAAFHGYTKIFATVSTADGAFFLENTLHVPKSNIFSTDSLDFQHGILRLTNGQGVAVVVGSEDRLSDSWPCIASFGRFVGVGEKDIFHSTANSSKDIVLPSTTKNIAFVSVSFQELAKSHVFADIFKHVLMLIEDDKVTIASPPNVFKQSEIEPAFRRIKDVDMVEKVVIEMDSDEIVVMELAQDSAKPLFRPDASYIIAGAFGGIGQSIARWMIQHGARHLILPSRSPVDGTGSERDHLVQELKAQGAAVYAPVCDIANRDQLRDMLMSFAHLPAVRGCIQAAMVMRDSSFANMTMEKWHESLAPKVDGSWNLHQLLPPGLDFFIMLSSSTGIMGSFGQSNYTVGNTYQDALAAHRMRHGQRAHTLALSMVTGVGYVAQNDQVQALLRVRGMLEEVPMDDIYNLLRFCCDPERVDTSTVGSQIITPLTLPADLRAMGIVAPLGSTRPIYHYLDTLPSRFSSDTASAEAKDRPSYKLSEATSLAQATDIVVEAIQTQLSSLLVVSRDDIDSQKAIYRYGVDSLVAVEMRNWFSKAIGADVGTTDIMSDISIWLLAVKVAGKSKFVRDELKE